MQVPNLSKQRQDVRLIALGTTLRRLRVEREISQERLALIAEVDRAYVGRIERGDNNAAILTLAKLAFALEVTLTELFAEAEL